MMRERFLGKLVVGFLAGMLCAVEFAQPVPPPIPAYTYAPGFQWTSGPFYPQYPGLLNVVLASSSPTGPWDILYIGPLDGAQHCTVELPHAQRFYWAAMTLGIRRNSQ